MPTIEVVWPSSVPASEIDRQFLQYMANRVAMSYFKYGEIADNFPEKKNALKGVEERIDLYKKTGNTEHLVDAANFVMIEFMRPSISSAEFRATDSHESPGQPER